jgi:hypothetical protein
MRVLSHGQQSQCNAVINVVWVLAVIKMVGQFIAPCHFDTCRKGMCTASKGPAPPVWSNRAVPECAPLPASSPLLHHLPPYRR